MPSKGERLAPRVTVVCPCGQEFEVTQKRYVDGRGRRCSKACQYAYMTRPSGLVYKKHVENPTAFKPGHTPWNSGTSETYRGIHRWLRRHKPYTKVCDWCGRKGTTEFANLSYKYHLDLDDWAELCVSCHRKYDHGNGGKAAVRFGKDVYTQ